MSAASGESDRAVLLVTNSRRDEVRSFAAEVSRALQASGISVRVGHDEIEEFRARGGSAVPGWTAVDTGEGAADGCELVIVLGGDGAILRGAERARGSGVPLLGINLGTVGFLAEAEREDADDVVRAVVQRDWQVEERTTLDIAVHVLGGSTYRTWALNEVSIEKAAREHMVDILVEIDGRPVSRWGCDGVVCATPTGSTAYAFSAGGPVVWPEVEALVVVPISAHALFARPLVVSPSSTIALELPNPAATAVMWADGRRSFDLPSFARVEVRRSDDPVRLARLHRGPFADRLVAKFDLPVQGWRGRR